MPEHLRLVEGGGHLGVQLQRRVEVVPERLLDHQAGRRIGAGAQANRRKPLRDLGEEARGDGQVEDALGGPEAGVVAVEPLGQALEQLRVGEVSLDDLQPGLERLPCVLVEAGARVGLDRLAGDLAERVHVVATRHAEHAHLVGEQPGEQQVVDGRQQLSRRQVPAGAEDDQRGGIGERLLRRPGRTDSRAPSRRSRGFRLPRRHEGLVSPRQLQPGEQRSAANARLLPVAGQADLGALADARQREAPRDLPRPVRGAARRRSRRRPRPRPRRDRRC